jgi:hypothetical protein
LDRFVDRTKSPRVVLQPAKWAIATKETLVAESAPGTWIQAATALRVQWRNNPAERSRIAVVPLHEIQG